MVGAYFSAMGYHTKTSARSLLLMLLLNDYLHDLL